MKARPHINLPVANLQESVSFYSKMFQTEPTKLKEDYANFRLESPLALHLALVETPGTPKKTIESTNGQHFGIELFDDKALQDWKSLVEKVGITPHLEEEQVICCYAVADKFWLEDPDGNQWEFWVRHDDDGQALFSEAQTEAACCAPKTLPQTESCCG